MMDKYDYALIEQQARKIDQLVSELGEAREFIKCLRDGDPAIEESKMWKDFHDADHST